MQIPFFDYKFLYSENRNNYIDIFDRVCKSGRFIMGEELLEFEHKLSIFVGSKYSIGVANATDALQLLLISCDFPEGSEVLVSSHTMIATVSAIKFAKLVPVIMDINEFGLIDADDIPAYITNKTVAIVPTQLNGAICEMDVINNYAKSFSLKVIEDSAQALGAKYNGISAGNFGIGGCISFYPAKTLGCFGDGGAIICNDVSVYNKIMSLRNHGKDIDKYKYWGYNSRLDNLQAAFLLYNLSFYPDTISYRRNIYSLYLDYLQDIPQLTLPRTLLSNKYFDICQNFEVQAENRDELIRFLKDKGIGTLVQWGGKLIHQMSDLNISIKLNKAEIFSKKYLMLPLNLTINENKISFIAANIKSFYKIK